MVKLTGPGLAKHASGSIADELTFATWKGRSYVKIKPTPKQPRSGPQVAMRSMLTFLSKNWAGLGNAKQASWDALAEAGRISPFNAFLQENLRRWRNFLRPSQAYPVPLGGTHGGVGAVSLTDRPRSLATRFFQGAPLNDNWAMTMFIVAADNDPPTWPTLIKITPIATSGWITDIITDLDPGPYWICFNRILTTGRTYPHSDWVLGNAL